MTRRDEIVHATLEILASTPLERVSTRGIAARVGLSQPALFRHFASREAILEAVVDWMAAELDRGAAAILAAPMGPLDRAERLAALLGEHAARWPGLPRLLLGDVARGEVGERLAGIARRQRALVASLVREAAPGVDAERAAAVFVAGMQGVLAHWLMEGARGLPDAAGFATLWRAGVEAGRPRGAAPAADLDRVEVDGVALLARGIDPLSEVLAASDRLAPGGELRVAVPFLPGPLVALFRGRGWAVELRAQGGGYLLLARRP